VAILAAAILIGATGCETDSSYRTQARAREVRIEPLVPLPPGATPRTISISPFTMSRLVTVAPEISLTGSELCDIITERARRELADGTQFQIVPPGQPADFVLRGEVMELMIGPETKVSTWSRFLRGGSGGSGSETSQVRPLDMVIEAELVDPRTGAVALRGTGAAKREIQLSQSVNLSGNYQSTSGEGGTTMEGYKFDQQHLQEVFRTAANQLAVDLSRKANDRIFLPEAQARRAPSNEINAATFR